jgi:methylated-DNA-protein-cysteine methyltransferase-like protein
MSKTQEFYEAVYQIVQLIPKGCVTSYGAIASCLKSGTPRMVGYAMRVSGDHTPTIPVHRVVNHIGIISGDIVSGKNWRIQLLNNEGIIVSDGKVVNFKKHFWDPSIEL